MIASQLFEIALLVTQLVHTSLLFEQTLTLVQEVLASLPILTIPFSPLLLFELPIALTPVVVVAIVVATIIPVPIAVAFDLATLSVLLLLLLASQLPIAILLLLLLLLASRLPVAILLLLLLLSLLFPALLSFLTVALLLLSLLFPPLLSILTLALLFLATLFPALLLLHLLLLRLLLLLGGAALLATLLAILLGLLARLLALLARRLVFLTPLLTAVSPALRVGEVAGSKQNCGNGQRQSNLLYVFPVHQWSFLSAGGERGVDVRQLGKCYSNAEIGSKAGQVCRLTERFDSELTDMG